MLTSNSGIAFQVTVNFVNCSFANTPPATEGSKSPKNAAIIGNSIIKSPGLKKSGSPIAPKVTFPLERTKTESQVMPKYGNEKPAIKSILWFVSSPAPTLGPNELSQLKATLSTSYPPLSFGVNRRVIPSRSNGLAAGGRISVPSSTITATSPSSKSAVTEGAS